MLSSLTIVQQPQSGAAASINGTNLLIDYNGLSFTGMDVITIRICDEFGECVTQTIEINVIGELEIYNAVSPNNDGKNDFFKIEYIEILEPENTVTIYNRWGSKVFEVKNYSEANAFRGLNQNGKNCRPERTSTKSSSYHQAKQSMGFGAEALNSTSSNAIMLNHLNSANI